MPKNPPKKKIDVSVRGVGVGEARDYVPGIRVDLGGDRNVHGKINVGVGRTGGIGVGIGGRIYF